MHLPLESSETPTFFKKARKNYTHTSDVMQRCLD